MKRNEEKNGMKFRKGMKISGEEVDIFGPPLSPPWPMGKKATTIESAKREGGGEEEEDEEEEDEEGEEEVEEERRM